MGTLHYSSNNSGGSWWLSDDDWRALESAGWTVHWVRDDASRGRSWARADKDGRWLGTLATTAEKADVVNPAEAVSEFERLTSQDAYAEGCNCCGPPHSFSFEGDDGSTSYLYVDYGPISHSWS